ncbi:MAG: hypothetical protein K6E85_03060 [Lachnospiraceae bacterium]|nr:hypothetical protein [Lachnospiraceae bacterium]
MQRILSSDCYRTIRSILTYALPVILVLVLIFELISGTRHVGEDTISDVLDTSSSLLMLVLAIADIVLIKLWSGEHRHGFIKNIAGNVSGRQILPLSKMIIAIGLCIIYSIFSFLFILCGNAIHGVKMVYAPFGDSLIQFLLWMLVGFVSAALLLMLHELFNSPTLCYIAVIMLWTGMFEEILIDLYYLIFKSDFNLARYTLICGMKVEESGNLEDLIRTLIYLAVFLGVAVFAARRKDVRA